MGNILEFFQLVYRLILSLRFVDLYIAYLNDVDDAVELDWLLL